MKRNSLTTALLAGLAGAAGLATSAHALNLNADGLGQALVYPYYTVNKGNQTLVSVVNTTNRVKAVKVRFLEGRNSKEVLDFNLYLSPFDVWTAAVTATGATGPAQLITADTSCTVPRITGPVPFRNFAYTGANQDWASATTPASLAALLGAIERTREGHLEMIELGLLQTGTLPTQLAEEATHNATGVPVNCNALVTAWTPPGGGWILNSAANIDTPAGGLYGAGTIVDVATGTLHAYNADAIEGFYTNTALPGFLHSNPTATDPDLGSADNGLGLINVNIFTGNGSLVTQTVPAGLKVRTTNAPYSYDAVSLLYQHDAIYNEYVTDAAIGASSEWVVTYPTKRFYVDTATAAAVRASPWRPRAGPSGWSGTPGRRTGSRARAGRRPGRAWRPAPAAGRTRSPRPPSPGTASRRPCRHRAAPARRPRRTPRTLRRCASRGSPRGSRPSQCTRGRPQCRRPPGGCGPRPRGGWPPRRRGRCRPAGPTRG